MRVVWFALVGLFTLIVPAVPASAAPASAQAQAQVRAALADGESITSYDTRVDVRADGAMRVTETIAYDFGTASRHGIIRQIPSRFRYDDHRDRVYPIDQVDVRMDGAAVAFEHSTSDGDDTLKIGDPDVTVTGRHTYAIGYTVRGALNHFTDHEELYWNVVGHEWQVPIASASAEVAGPVAATRVSCFSGPEGSRLGCDQSTIEAGTGRFRQSNLGNGAGLTAVVAFPSGSVSSVEPILVDRHDLAAAFEITWLTVGIAVALALLGAAIAIWAAWRHGRDRRYLGVLPGLVPERGEPAVERRKPLFGAPPVSVEFGPPDRLRPGQVGTLVDERANVVDVTATIVDFAVRKYLRIREIRPDNEEQPRDWELTRLRKEGKEFLPYERDLFYALFRDGEKVRLSELTGTFSGDLAKTRRKLYEDMVKQGWYARSPAATRRAVRAIGALCLIGAVAVTVVLALTTHVALIGVGLVLAAVAPLAVAGRFPARTGRGSAALERIRGFRLYIATTEKEQIAFQERVQIFSEFLPYAMVFGLVERWAHILDGLDAPQLERLDWYSGPGPFTAGALTGSFLGFQRMATGTIATTAVHAATGSSAGFSGFAGGFSGGGAGGGGGGSW